MINNTVHELYFDRVVIFWIKYNEAPKNNTLKPKL